LLKNELKKITSFIGTGKDTNTITMEKNKTVITECFQCGTRYENYFKASPCCKSIILKIDEHGNRTNITFLSTFSIPKSDPPVSTGKPNENNSPL